MKKFDFVVGNPPYHKEAKGNNESDTPLYHYFYDSASKIAEKIELITPARFLFNAGYTPKKWNEKMLNDPHFKVLHYEANSTKIFPNADIKGGVAISYIDSTQCFEPIEVFTSFPELNSIRKKVDKFKEDSLSNIISNRGLYKYSDKAYLEENDELKKSADARIAPSAFERMPNLFTDEKPSDNNEYIRIYGLLKGKRIYKWFRKDYLKEVENLYKYKVLIPSPMALAPLARVSVPHSWVRHSWVSQKPLFQLEKPILEMKPKQSLNMSKQNSLELC